MARRFADNSIGHYLRDCENILGRWKITTTIQCGALAPITINGTLEKYLQKPDEAADKELVKALKQYGSHIGTCPRRAWSAEQAGCTCGFDKAHNHAQSPNARRADSGAGESEKCHE